MRASNDMFASIAATVMPSRSKTGAVPLGVALGEVVVDRDEVDALAGERVQIERQARDERLSFTGLHLGDVALVQDDAAHHLDVEDALVGLAQARLAHGGERLEEDVLELLAVREPLAELDRLPAQLVVGELAGSRAPASRCRRPARRGASCAAPRRSGGPSRGIREQAFGTGYPRARARSPRPPRGRRRAAWPGRRTPVPPALPPRSNAGAASNDGRAVDVQRPALPRHDELELACPRGLRASSDDDRRGADGPGRPVLPPRLGAERRVERRLDGVGERPDGLVGRSAVDEERAVGERDEVGRVSLEPRRRAR